ncbi:hypothetical protein [Desulfosporosinus lacus]|nr:hypothetical protein [Desulfosporosinus lacus]
MKEKLSLASGYGLAESRVANFETLRDIAITKIALKSWPKSWSE